MPQNTRVSSSTLTNTSLAVGLLFLGASSLAAGFASSAFQSRPSSHSARNTAPIVVEKTVIQKVLADDSCDAIPTPPRVDIDEPVSVQSGVTPQAQATVVSPGAQLNQLLIENAVPCDTSALVPHQNGGGLVPAAVTPGVFPAVGDSVFVGKDAVVCGGAQVEGNVVLNGQSVVYGNAKIFAPAGTITIGDAEKPGETQRVRVGGQAVIQTALEVDDIQLVDEVLVVGNAEIGTDGNGKQQTIVMGDRAQIFGRARVSGLTNVRGNAKVFGSALVRTANIDDEARVYGGTIIGEYNAFNGTFYKPQSYLSSENAFVHQAPNVFGSAVIAGNASLYGPLNIYDNAAIFGTAHLSRNTAVYQKARVCGNATIEDATIRGGARISGEVNVNGQEPEDNFYDPTAVLLLVDDTARIHGRSIVTGAARVYGSADVTGFSSLEQTAEVFGAATISDHARITDKAKVCGTAKVLGTTVLAGTAQMSTGIAEDGIVSEGVLFGGSSCQGI